VIPDEPAMHEPMPSLAAPSIPVPMEFSGSKGLFAKMVIRGGLLELLTLGFYRFWLTTDMRRHLWSHTSVGGAPAEYTGRARELLIGFLIAMAILVPLYLAFFVLTMEAERLQAFASIPIGFLIYVLVQYAIYRARRYRVTRTVWRGLRFSMGGSGWSYAWRAVLWTLFTIITLGIAWPWRAAALERFKMRHTAYGSLHGEFTGTGWQLFKRVWFFALLLPIGYVTMIGLPLVWAIFRAVEWRWWISNLKFGEVTFESDMDWGDLIAPYFKVLGWVALIFVLFAVLGIGVPYAMLIGFESAPTEEQIVGHPAIIAGVIAGYLVFAISIGAAIRVYLMRDVWAIIAKFTLIYNLHLADDVEGQGVASDALGEGFADGLDIGGGF
jgi:uncharacterized membrane protein YjgN (DUF898 family)